MDWVRKVTRVPFCCDKLQNRALFCDEEMIHLNNKFYVFSAWYILKRHTYINLPISNVGLNSCDLLVDSRHYRVTYDTKTIPGIDLKLTTIVIRPLKFQSFFGTELTTLKFYSLPEFQNYKPIKSSKASNNLIPSPFEISLLF